MIRRTAWTKVTVLIVALLVAMVLPGCPPPLGDGGGDTADGDAIAPSLPQILAQLVGHDRCPWWFGKYPGRGPSRCAKVVVT